MGPEPAPIIIERPEASVSSDDVTQITRRTDLSVLYRVIRTVIRPIRPKLCGIKPSHHEGSPHLHKRPDSYKGVNITERKVTVVSRPERPLPQADGREDHTGSNSQTLWVYDFEPQRSHAQIDRDGAKCEYRHTVYYFAGGGFQSHPSGDHWKMCAGITADLADSGVRFVLVSYPLAPASSAKETLPLLRNWLLQVLKDAHDNARADEYVTLMGDSAGGNIVLSLAFWWSDLLELVTEELVGRDAAIETAKRAELAALKRLRSVFVICPPTDFRNVNPKIEAADKLDPILTSEITEGAADAWCKDWVWARGEPKADPTLSPALHESGAWEKLRQSHLVVNGIYGTADLLAPDCEVFLNLCRKERIPGKWLVWEGQMHVFPIIAAYGVTEARQAMEWAKERIKDVL